MSAVVAVLSLAATGCGDGSDGGGRSAAALVIPSAAGSPGTAIGDGFTVAPGTVLVGDAIPLGVTVVVDGEEVVDEGWTATSVVDGSPPTRIVQDYLRQARALDMEEQPGTGCGLNVEVVICSGFARSSDERRPRSLAVAVVRGMRDDVASDHVVVRYSTTSSYWEYGQFFAGADGEADAPPPVRVTTPLPSVGDPLPTAGELWNPVVVQRGSRLAGPPVLNLNDATGGVVAILEVTAAPEVVLDDYLAHLTSLNLHGTAPETRALGQSRVTSAWRDTAGGDGYKVTLVQREGRPTWLVVEGSHD